MKRELWTVQDKRVLEELLSSGCYRVKRSYVMKKYGESAWIFQTAYDFFIRELRSRIAAPEGAESPVWLFSDSRSLFRAEGEILMRLEIPREELLFFDARDWNRVLNLSYLGGEEERERFRRELLRQGIRSEESVFQSAFYPLQRAKIQKSWRRLFEAEEEAIGKSYRQAAVWQLKKEWLMDYSVL